MLSSNCKNLFPTNISNCNISSPKYLDLFPQDISRIKGGRINSAQVGLLWTSLSHLMHCAICQFTSSSLGLFPFSCSSVSPVVSILKKILNIALATILRKVKMSDSSEIIHNMRLFWWTDNRIHALLEIFLCIHLLLHSYILALTVKV